ncbi:MAG: hypothetical protein ACFB6S_03120 [Geminicoccaceae bacterium]
MNVGPSHTSLQSLGSNSAPATPVRDAAQRVAAEPDTNVAVEAAGASEQAAAAGRSRSQEPVSSDSIRGQQVDIQA